MSKDEWSLMRDEIKLKEPNKDCFAYSDKTAVPCCRALNDLYCRKEECHFYKPGKWDDVVTKNLKGE
jgi:hypothetical protein